MAEAATSPLGDSSPAEGDPEGDPKTPGGFSSTGEGFEAPGDFDRDTAVSLRETDGPERVFAAEVSPDWRAGRGPHGGYLAAMLLRALSASVAEPARAPRSLTIHYARAPDPGPVRIRTVIEREGRSLSTLSARIETAQTGNDGRDGTLIALALAAFSVPWAAQEIAELPMPDVPPPDPVRESGPLLNEHAPPFVRHLVIQPRIGAIPFTGSDRPMEIGGWLGLREPRPIDAFSLAFFSDALFSPPFIRLDQPAVTPTIDLTVHFRTPMPRAADLDPDPEELCLVRFRSGLVHEGFFEEDGVIWAADGTVLAQSRQLGIVLPLSPTT